MAIGDIVFVDSSVVAIQAYDPAVTADLVELQGTDTDQNREGSALISGTITKSPQSIIRARATMGESFSPSIPSKSWSADLDLELRVDGFDGEINKVLANVIPPSATAGQWLLKVAFMANSPSAADGDIAATATSPIYKVVVALESHTPINPGDSSAEQTFTLRGGAFKYVEDYKGTFSTATGGALKNSATWPGVQA